MENTSNKEKEQIQNHIELAIWVLPAIILPMMAEFIPSQIPEIALSVILGGLGGIIGATLFWLTKDKSKLIKIGALSLILIGLIGLFIYFNNQAESEKGNFLTCEICGYQSLSGKNQEPKR